MQSRSLMWLTEPSYLTPRHWNQGPELGTEPRYSMWDTSIFTDVLAARLKIHPLNAFVIGRLSWKDLSKHQGYSIYLFSRHQVDFPVPQKAKAPGKQYMSKCNSGTMGSRLNNRQCHRVRQICGQRGLQGLCHRRIGLSSLTSDFTAYDPNHPATSPFPNLQLLFSYALGNGELSLYRCVCWLGQTGKA